MMKHVDEHHDVEAGIGVRNADPIEGPRGNLGVRSNQHVDAFDRHVGPSLRDELVDCPVPATDVEHAGFGGIRAANELRQDSYTPPYTPAFHVERQPRWSRTPSALSSCAHAKHADEEARKHDLECPA